MTYSVTLYDEGPASFTVKGKTGKHYTFKRGEATEVEALDYYGLMAYAQLKFPKATSNAPKRAQPIDHKQLKGSVTRGQSMTKAQAASIQAQQSISVTASSRRTLADMKRELHKSNEATDTDDTQTEE